MGASANLKGMTYGIIAISLLIFAIVWFVVTGRADKRIEEMETAIEQGDEELFTALLKASPKVVENLSDVTFLLLKSIIANRASMVQELLYLGHPVAEIQECAGEHGVDLLSESIESADADVLRILLVAGMKETAEGTAPVLTCYAAGKPEHLKVLKIFEATGLTAKQSEPGYTPLHAAAMRFADNAETILTMVKPLLESGADVNALTACGNTPLDYAMDRTHEGSGGTEPLIDLLRSYGARRGRCLRVPVPAYTGRVYFSSEQPTAAMPELPQGVELQLHALQTVEIDEALFPQAFSTSAANKAAVRAHRSYADLQVRGSQGDDPLEVAGRGLSVLAAFAETEGVVGVQFEQTLLLPAEYVVQYEDGTFNPLLYAELSSVRTQDKTVLVDTSGLARFGLSEVELIVAYKAIKKNANELLNGLGSDLLSVVLAGNSAWEAGHTASLRGMFCHIAYGKHSITENEGLVFVVGEE